MASETSYPVTVIFALENKVGALKSVLSAFSAHGVDLQHIESRPSKKSFQEYEFIVTVNSTSGYQKVFDALKSKGTVKVVTSMERKTSCDIMEENTVPWFPRKIKDLDLFANRILGCGTELDADHPGSKDQEYRARRREITEIAASYQFGQPIPKVQYKDYELATWKTVFNSLTGLYQTHACKEFNYVFPLLMENCGYNENNIPQLEDISNFLKDCTGFTLRPVAGLLSSRDFLAGLAFRVFHSTQYIRHHSVPMYTPEPDVCHELLGHVPLFADPAFADFSQEIGLASLGASDEDIKKLATCYWFTVEFGLCRQDGELKAFGAGLLSSFGELQYCLSDKPTVLDFEPEKTGIQEYPITQFQPVYFAAESFQDAKMRLRRYAATINRPFTVRYNAFTQSIEVIDKREDLHTVIHNIKNDVLLLENSLNVIRF